MMPWIFLQSLLDYFGSFKIPVHIKLGPVIHYHVAQLILERLEVIHYLEVVGPSMQFWIYVVAQMVE